ncbi:hypothetical protein [Psychromarinibacter halotolerans]|uniref:Uncharacterized protein n=1 Tax=Psychromarinibacter halotolerans TaxID=1775175 RepID=A0ABV7GM16_9RHOB|nr:hypothetical protein [Psychromarinibacter halotolerans]MDF0595825.1 hypothetical protein [Psychromarinibacter halotolerans]
MSRGIRKIKVILVANAKSLLSQRLGHMGKRHPEPWTILPVGADCFGDADA